MEGLVSNLTTQFIKHVSSGPFSGVTCPWNTHPFTCGRLSTVPSNWTHHISCLSLMKLLRLTCACLPVTSPCLPPPSCCCHSLFTLPLPSELSSTLWRLFSLQYRAPYNAFWEIFMNSMKLDSGVAGSQHRLEPFFHEIKCNGMTSFMEFMSLPPIRMFLSDQFIVKYMKMCLYEVI